MSHKLINHPAAPNPLVAIDVETLDCASDQRSPGKAAGSVCNCLIHQAVKPVWLGGWEQAKMRQYLTNLFPTLVIRNFVVGKLSQFASLARTFRKAQHRYFWIRIPQDKGFAVIRQPRSTLTV
jgi:hypothetical protein